MTSTLRIFALCLGVAGFALSQDNEPAAARPADPKVLTQHQRVEVTLKNGSVFLGVVLDGRFVEKPRRAAYVALNESEKDDLGAGIRLWYYQNLQGFMFLQYRSIERVRVLGRLSEADLNDITAAVAANEKAKAASSVLPAKTSFSGLSLNDKAKDSGLSGWNAVSGKDAEILRKFSPDAGFSPELYETLQRTMIVDGTLPSALQDEWFLVYPDWLSAYRKFSGVEQNPAAKTTSATPPGKNGSTGQAPAAKPLAKPLAPKAPKSTPIPPESTGPSPRKAKEAIKFPTDAAGSGGSSGATPNRRLN